MKERTRNIVVGITTLAGGVSLVSLLLLFGYVPEFVQQGYTVRIEMNNAGGVMPGNRVLYQGLDVGQITEVRRKAGLAAGVELIARINEDQDLPDGASVVVSRPALGGSPTVEFMPPDHMHDQPMSKNGQAMVHGEVTSAFQQLGESVQKSIDGLVGNLKGDKDSEGILAKLNDLADEWKQVGQNINELTAPLSPDKVDADPNKMANLSTVIARADMAIIEMDKTLNGINSYLYDDALKSNIETTAANAKELTGNIAKWSTKIDGFTGDIGNNVKQLREAYVNVANRLSVFIDRGNKLVEATQQGKGTVGKMVTDPQLYNNLNDAANRLNQALDDVKLLIEKWKAEGVPIQL